MLRSSIRLMFAVFISCYLAGCSSSVKPEHHIPGNTMVVLRFDLPAVVQKTASYILEGDLSLDDIFPASTDSFSFNFQNTGIDPRWPVYAYSLADQRLDHQQKYVVLLPILHQQSFTDFVQTAFPEAMIGVEQDIRTVAPNDFIAISWDKQLAAIALTQPYKGSAGKAYSPVEYQEILKATALQALHLSKEQSITQDPLFKTWEIQAQDLGLWINLEALGQGLPSDEIGSIGAILSAQPKLIKRARLFGGLQFNDGKLSGDMRLEVNDTALAIMKALLPDTVNKAMVDRIIGERLNLFFQLQLKTPGLKTMADSMGVLPLAVTGLSEIDLSTEDVLHAFGGAFQFVLSDYKVHTRKLTARIGADQMDYISPETEMNTLFSFSIHQQQAFEKIVQSLRREGIVYGNSQDDYAIPFVGHLHYDSAFGAIASNRIIGTGFLNGVPGGSRVNEKIPPAVIKHALGLYIDVQGSLQDIPLELLYGKEAPEVFLSAKNLVADFSIYSDVLEDKHLPFHLELNFQNKKKNSLIQLIDFGKLLLLSEREALKNEAPTDQ